MDVVIVESPAKAKTINKYLGPGYQVIASYGHVRDLPPKNGSVQPDDDFAMSWEVDPKSAKRLSDIAAAVKGAKRLILATDPDREGEAISWHVLEVLKGKKVLDGVAVSRVVFNAITKSAISEGMANARQIDRELVDAYLARRALDYLVGFTLSPVLWRKLPGSRSAGRVQSVALRLVCERELEIEKFRAEEYWTVETNLGNGQGATFPARLTELNGQKVEKFTLKNEAQANAAAEAIRRGTFRVASVESRPARRNPPPPFITSTLQQEASRKLGFSASRTMQTAQRLYEGIDIGGETTGLITYMRTDGVDIAPEGIAELRAHIGEAYGKRYLPAEARVFKSKLRNAQEAHEAIRPTSPGRLPEELARFLEADQAKLYELIWKRTLACQMEAAEFERTTVEIPAADGSVTLRATGSVQLFDGFLKLYQEGRDDDSTDEDATRLPRLAAGDAVSVTGVKPEQHFTEPPPRFSEATLVKRMEELGIGRPSTYASVLTVLRDRLYVRMDRGRFIPEDKGRIVTTFLENFFRRYVEYDFTAALEDQLDQVSSGALKWKDLLRAFWTDFIAAIEKAGELRITQVIDVLDEVLAPHLFPPREDGSDPRLCPTCKSGKLGLRLGRFGAFLGCSNYPECNFTRPLSTSGEAGSGGPRKLGDDPATGLPLEVKVGRFGPYIERAPAPGEEKPKRAGIPKGWSVAELTLEQAIQLIGLPRDIGTHPETGEKIVANFGRFGPYVSHQGSYANLDSAEEVFSVGINRAVTLLAEKAQRGGGRQRAAPLREIGKHPADGKPVALMKGKYGVYVNHAKTNATLPRDADPEKVTLEEALALIAAKGGAKAKLAKVPKAKSKPKDAKAADAKPEKKKTAKPKGAAKPAAKKSTKAAAKAAE